MTGADLQSTKELVCELCRNFYSHGWVSGTGGGISIKHDDNQIVVAPSGVQKERMLPEDMFVLDNKGNIIHTPEARPPPYKPPKLSECTPLFMAVRGCSTHTAKHTITHMQAYELRGAGAVMHSHSLNAVMATMIDEHAPEFKVTHLEMIKGIVGHGFYGNCIVPIIENTARECELTDRLRQAIVDYPESNAVLVRRHGVYVWGRTWIEAKTQSECYDYLFESALRMRQLGVDASVPPPPPALTANGAAVNGAAANGTAVNGTASKAKRPRLTPTPLAIVLDIEGTVAPISYVAETLFPYAAKHVERHLRTTFDQPPTQRAVQALRELGAADAAEGRSDAVTVPEDAAGSDAVIGACLKSVKAQMASDRKTTALKLLQVWHDGFARGDLKCDLYRDVPDALVEWRALGIKTYIYSSGSRQAQRDLFGHTTAGDLRPYLSGFFDTVTGPKTVASSYAAIAEHIGVDDAQQLLFVTDNVLEAVAAREAGWGVVVAVRPGNAALPEGHGFKEVSSMTQLL